jgi:hypothetical protein
VTCVEGTGLAETTGALAPLSLLHQRTHRATSASSPACTCGSFANTGGSKQASTKTRPAADCGLAGVLVRVPLADAGRGTHLTAPTRGGPDLALLADVLRLLAEGMSAAGSLCGWPLGKAASKAASECSSACLIELTPSFAVATSWRSSEYACEMRCWGEMRAEMGCCGISRPRYLARLCSSFKSTPTLSSLGAPREVPALSFLVRAAAACRWREASQ